MNTKLISILVCLPGILAAQEYTVSLSNPKGTTLTINVSNTNLKIIGSNRSDILIKSITVISNNDDRAEGLVAVGRYEDNTGIGLYYGKNDDGIIIEKINAHQKQDYEFQVPNNVNIILKEQGWNKRSVNISGITGEINIKTNNSDIIMSDMRGPVRAKSTSGDVIASIVNASGIKGSFSSVSGRVDITIPSGLKSNLKLKTISGRIDSDVEIFTTKLYKGSKLRQIGYVRKAEVSLNGGGELLELSSISGVVKLHLISN